MPQIESQEEADWLSGQVESGAITSPEAVAALQEWDAVNSSEDGLLVEGARAVEGFMEGAYVDGEERRELLDLISKAPKPEGYENLSLDEKVLVDQQALWDEIPTIHRFAIGFDQAITSTGDWVLESVGLGDGDARRFREEAYAALDDNNQDASDAGEVVGMIAEMATPGGAIRGSGKIIGTAWALGGGVLRFTGEALRRLRNYNPKAVEKVAKTEEGKNLLKAAQDPKANTKAQQGFEKRVKDIDPAVNKVELVHASAKAPKRIENPNNLNPIQLKAQRNKQSESLGVRQQARAEKVQKPDEATAAMKADYDKAQKTLQNYHMRRTLGIDKGAKVSRQQANKAAAKKLPGGF